MAFIYFIRERPDGAIKIGMAADIPRRHSSLQSGNPRPLEVLGVMLGNSASEQRLHKHFARWRVHGEWFMPCKELFNFMSLFACPYRSNHYQADAMENCPLGHDISAWLARIVPDHPVSA